MSNHTSNAKLCLQNKIRDIRAQSEAAWEMAADTARDDAAAAEFIKQWDVWGEVWDVAEDAIEDGRYRDAVTLLNACRTLEEYGGDDSHATAALALVTPFTAPGCSNLVADAKREYRAAKVHAERAR